MPKSRRERPSSTSGRLKGQNCHKTELKNLHSKHTKLHRQNPKMWNKCCDAVDKEKGNRPGIHNFVEITFKTEINNEETVRAQPLPADTSLKG